MSNPTKVSASMRRPRGEDKGRRRWDLPRIERRLSCPQKLKSRRRCTMSYSSAMGGRGPILTSTTLVVVSVVLLFMSPTSAGEVVRSASSWNLAGETYQVGVSPSAQLSQASIASAVASVYSHLQSLGVASSTLLPQETVAGTVAELFNKVATTPAFSAAAQSPGTGGLVFSLKYSDTIGVTYASFGFNSISAGVGNSTYWLGDLATNHVSGPVVSRYPLTRASMIDSANWAGWSFWGSGTPQLNGVQSDENVPTISVPPQGNGGTVDAVVSTWIGLTGKNSNDILQTGFARDATNPNNWNYNMWYEFYPYNYMTPYSPSITVAPGNDVWEAINWQGGLTWTLNVDDFTTGKGILLTLDLANLGASSFVPYYTDFIVEAYSSSNGIQQIAEFTPAVNFYDTEFCTYNGQTCYTSYTAGSANTNIYQLQQNCNQFLGLCYSNIDNTNQVYTNGYGGYFGGYGYPDVSWVTSSYSYTFVNG